MPVIDPAPPLHGDLSKRVFVDSTRLPWTASPSKTVWRKRLHRVGPSESGQVTSLVRYEPGAAFPVHDHPGGEEILVLEGVFSDEYGDWPAGAWLLNPEGFRHAPFSREGCLLFVKLRQAAGAARRQVALDTTQIAWLGTGIGGIERKALAAQREYPDSTWLERWKPGVALNGREFEGGAELFVLEGAFSDDDGDYGRGSWLRLPVGSKHHPVISKGCVLYVKVDALRDLRLAD